jgi:hypothetical protein
MSSELLARSARGPTEAVRLQLKGFGYSVPREDIARAIERAGFVLVRPSSTRTPTEDSHDE